MLKEILSLIGLIKGAPPAVDIYAFPPLSSPLPKEIREKLGTQDDPYCGLHPVHIGIENLSNIVLTNIRVKLTSPSIYHPIVENGDTQRPLEWRHDIERAEIHITALDPSDSAYIVFFPKETFPKDKSVTRVFQKPEILIEGKRVSTLQEQLGFLKKEPSLAIFFILLLSVIIGIVFLVVFSFYPHILPNSDRALTEQATQQLVSGCQLKPVKVTTNTRSDIAANGLPPLKILQINRASSIEELLNREKIVLCK